MNRLKMAPRLQHIPGPVVINKLQHTCTCMSLVNVSTKLAKNEDVRNQLQQDVPDVFGVLDI